MTTAPVSSIARTGPAIAAALDRVSPSSRDQFESEFRDAIDEASSSLDLSMVEEVVDKWWQIALSRSVELTDAEEVQIARARNGDFSSLQIRDPDGSFSRLA